MSNDNSKLDWSNPNPEWTEKWNDVGKASHYRDMSHHEFSPTMHTTITLTVHHTDDGKVTRGKVSLNSYGHSLSDFNISETLTMDEMKKQACAVCLNWLQIRYSRVGQLIDILSKL